MPNDDADGGAISDGGSGSAAGDAAVPTTLVHTDSGVDILLYDYGTPTDCAGIVPAPEDFQPVSMTIVPDGGSCPPPMTDESGVIALGSGGTPPIGRYLLLSNDADAGVVGQFAPGVPIAKLRGELDGFSAAVEDDLFDGTFEPGDAGWTLAKYARDGTLISSVRQELNPGDTSAVTPLVGGGYAMIVGKSGNGTVSRKLFADGTGWQWGNPATLATIDGGMPVLFAANDAAGHLLLQSGWPGDPAACENRWYDSDGNALGDCVRGYASPLGEIRSLLSAVSFRRLMDNPPDVFLVIPEPGSAPPAVPDMLRQWTLVRRSSAYANWGQRCVGDFCSFAPGSMDLLSRSGTKCATLSFRDTNIFVGRDGTVIEQSSCSYRWFPQLLR
jgi:hypothetical protein